MATIHDESLCDLDAGKVLQLNAPNYDQIDVLVARPICIYSRLFFVTPAAEKN